MSGVPEVIKGAFKFSVTGDAITVSAMGTTKVRFPKAATPGDLIIIDLTGYSYTVDFNTYPVDSGCGLTTTASWGNAMPWFVYLANVNDTPAGVFAFNTRDPRMSVTPAVGLINDTDAKGATAQSQNHINSFEADDVANAAKPCICIGSHTMTWDTADDRWTCVALTTNDGFGKFQEGVQFTMPIGQNGAISTSHGIANGGTVPTWTTDTATYYQRRDGTVRYKIYLNGDAGADGAGAVTAYLSTPLDPVTEAGVTSGNGHIMYSEYAGAVIAAILNIDATGIYWTVQSNGTPQAWSVYGNGTRRLSSVVEYPAF